MPPCFPVATARLPIDTLRAQSPPNTGSTLQYYCTVLYCSVLNRTRSATGLYRYTGTGRTVELKEESDFRNERDVVPAGIRTGPNPQILFFVFWKGGTLQRDAEVESF